MVEKINDRWLINKVTLPPARYNYAFPPGYKEVEEILQSKPLHLF